MSESDAPTPDPLVTPFITALLDYRERVQRQVATLSDDELLQVYDLFGRDNIKSIPVEFWPASFTVRARIRVEQKRRLRAAATTVGANA